MSCRITGERNEQTTIREYEKGRGWTYRTKHACFTVQNFNTTTQSTTKMLPLQGVGQE